MRRTPEEPEPGRCADLVDDFEDEGGRPFCAKRSRMLGPLGLFCRVFLVGF